MTEPVKQVFWCNGSGTQRVSSWDRPDRDKALEVRLCGTYKSHPAHTWTGQERKQ